MEEFAYNINIHLHLNMHGAAAVICAASSSDNNEVIDVVREFSIMIENK